MNLEASNDRCITCINKRRLLREIISFSFNDTILLIPMWSIFKWSWMSSSWDTGKLNTFNRCSKFWTLISKWMRIWGPVFKTYKQILKRVESTQIFNGLCTQFLHTYNCKIVYINHQAWMNSEHSENLWSCEWPRFYF